MMTTHERLSRCLKQLRTKTDFVPRVGLILGSGLGDFAANIDVECSVAYSELEGFPVSTVPGHQGRYIFGRIKGVPVCCMQGRIHFYEGYDMQTVVLPVRLMRMMGAQILFITNAAGGINTDFKPASLMLIEDHISTFIGSPLIGPNEEELGLRFPDMTKVYDTELRGTIAACAAELDIELFRGVYCQLPGPQFETPSEIRMLRIMGADAVGMSSVCEAIAARHMGMRVCGVSCISNLAAGMTGMPLTHEEVISSADAAAINFKALVAASIAAF